MLIEKYFNIPRWERHLNFSELSRLQERLDRLLGSFSDLPSESGGAGVFPPVNITETGDHIVVRAELPGVAAEDLNVNITGTSLVISGERKIKDRGDGVTYHRRERSGGTFNRVLTLPSDVDEDQIDAGLINGVLTIALPKTEAAKPKQIIVK